MHYIKQKQREEEILTALGLYAAGWTFRRMGSELGKSHTYWWMLLKDHPEYLKLKKLSTETIDK